MSYYKRHKRVELQEISYFLWFKNKFENLRDVSLNFNDTTDPNDFQIQKLGWEQIALIDNEFARIYETTKSTDENKLVFSS